MVAVFVLENAATDGFGLALVFAAIREIGLVIHFTKNQLTHALSGLKFDRERAGVVELESDATFKSGIDPACILNEKSDSSDGAAAFDESREIVWKFHILLRGREKESVRRNSDSVRGDFAILDLGVEGKHVHLCVLENEEVVADATVDGGGLDGLFVNGVDDEFTACDHCL